MAQDTGFDALVKRIALQLRERGFCLVFEAELERYWPSEKIEHTERQKNIEAFAKSHGWTASILAVESGIRAIFQKQKIGVTYVPTSDLTDTRALFDYE